MATKAYINTYASEVSETDILAFCKNAFDHERIKADLEDTDLGHWIAAEGSAVVGYLRMAVNQTIDIQGLPSEPYVQLDRMYVDVDRKGQGIGGLLMEKAIEFCMEKRQTRIVLVVLDGNTQARGFYSHQGFEEAGTGEHRLAGKLMCDRMMVKTLTE